MFIRYFEIVSRQGSLLGISGLDSMIGISSREQEQKLMAKTLQKRVRRQNGVLKKVRPLRQGFCTETNINLSTALP